MGKVGELVYGGWWMKAIKYGGGNLVRKVKGRPGAASGLRSKGQWIELDVPR